MLQKNVNNNNNNKNSTVSFPGKTPFKLKQMPLNQTLSIPHLLQAQPASPTNSGLLLRFYNNVQTEWHCIDPNQTDS